MWWKFKVQSWFSDSARKLSFCVVSWKISTCDFKTIASEVHQWNQRRNVIVCKLDKINLEFALSKFIAEVTKVKDGSDYLGRTLYQMIVSIQKHLNESGCNWKLVDGPDFGSLRNVLDNVMKERAANNIGLVKRQAEYISLDFEDKLWNYGILGEDSPDKLRDTVLFLLGINLALCAGDEHYDLRHNTDNKPSQLAFKRDSSGVKSLVYSEDTTTKTNDGGLKSMKKERKVVWVYRSKNSVRCPVWLVEKYISLCPVITPKSKKLNFYLRSLEKPTVVQWYGEQVVGLNSLRKVVTNLLKSGNLDGFFTNHSLWRSGTTRLFQSGLDPKIIKDYTGHHSDALHAYEVISAEQRKNISEILRGSKSDDNVVETEPDVVPKSTGLEITVSNNSKGGCMSCTCNKQSVNVSKSDKISDLIQAIMNSNKQGKPTIKLEISFDNWEV